MSATRVVHCKKEPYDVYIGRGRCPRTGKPGVWGNDWSHLEKTVARYKTSTVEEAIRLHRLDLLSDPEQMKIVRQELRGKVLGCWCAGTGHACHGDIYAEIADMPEEDFQLLLQMPGGAEREIGLEVKPLFFQQIEPQLNDRIFVFTLAKTGETTLRLTVIPQVKGNTKEETKITPLVVDGTAKELDENLPKALQEFSGVVQGFRTNLDQIKIQAQEQLDEAKKTAETAKGKTRSKGTAAGRPVAPVAAQAATEAAAVVAGLDEQAEAPTGEEKAEAPATEQGFQPVAPPAPVEAPHRRVRGKKLEALPLPAAVAAPAAVATVPAEEPVDPPQFVDPDADEPFSDEGESLPVATGAEPAQAPAKSDDDEWFTY